MTRKLSLAPVPIPPEELAAPHARMTAAAERRQAHIEALKLKDDLEWLAKNDLMVPKVMRQ